MQSNIRPKAKEKLCDVPHCGRPAFMVFGAGRKGPNLCGNCMMLIASIRTIVQSKSDSVTEMFKKLGLEVKAVKETDEC